jgi:nitrate/nitrite transporter NarK
LWARRAVLSAREAVTGLRSEYSKTAARTEARLLSAALVLHCLRCHGGRVLVEVAAAPGDGLTNLAGAGAPALVGWMLSTTGSYTPGFLFLVATIVVSIACCAVLIPQRY